MNNNSGILKQHCASFALLARKIETESESFLGPHHDELMIDSLQGNT